MMAEGDPLRVLLIMTARVVGGAELYAAQLVAHLTDACGAESRAVSGAQSRAVSGEQSRAVSGERDRIACRFTVAMSDGDEMDDLARRLAQQAAVARFPFDRARRLPGVVRSLARLAAGYDVIHLTSNHPASRLGILMGFVLPQAGRPVVAVEQSPTLPAAVRLPGAIAWALPALFRWSRRRVARIVVPSQQGRATLTDYYRLPADKIDLIYNGVDLDRFAPQPSILRHELGLADNQPVILTVGRLAANKGQADLIAAAPIILERFPRAHIILAGDATDRAPLDAQIAALGLGQHVTLLGHRTDVANLLHGADLFVMPSLAEGFSLALVEALAAGLAIVATAVGIAPEVIVPGRNGLLVPPADAPALADAVIRVLGLDEAARAAYRSAARAAAARFSCQATAQQTLALYREVTADGRLP